MKVIKNKIYLVMFTLLLCLAFPLGISVQASGTTATTDNDYIQLPAQSNVNLDELMTVTFPENFSTDEFGGAVVQKDLKFIPVDVTVIDSKTIFVKPINSYDENSQYTLKAFFDNGKKYSLNFTTGKSTYSKAKVVSITVVDEGTIKVRFDRAMDTNTALVASNWELNNQKLSDIGLIQNDFSISGDNNVITIKNLNNHINSGSNVLYISPNVKDNTGINIDEDTRLSFDSSSKPSSDKASIVSDSFKIYYEGDDIKAEVKFTKALDTINRTDFTVAGETPDSAAIAGDKLMLIFKDGSKDGNGLNKVDVIRDKGVYAMLTSVQNPSTSDEDGLAISYIAPTQVYSYLLAPRTVPAKYYAASNGRVVFKFDSKLDTNSAIKLDDFSVSTVNGTELKANSVIINQNTNEVSLSFSLTDRNNLEAFTTQKYVKVVMKPSINIRGLKDKAGNYSIFVPSSEDLKISKLDITK